MEKNRIVSLRDLFVSEACINGKISELRKWSSHFAFHFPKKTEEAVWMKKNLQVFHNATKVIMVCPHCLEEFELSSRIQMLGDEQFLVSYVKKYGLDKASEILGFDKKGPLGLLILDLLKGETREE